MLTREPGEFECVLRAAHPVAAHQFEQRQMLSSKRERAGMRDDGEARPSAFDKGQRALDFAEWPKSNRRANQYGEADVESKAKGQIVIAARLE